VVKHRGRGRARRFERLLVHADVGIETTVKVIDRIEVCGGDK
jgi:hypothetical protein